MSEGKRQPEKEEGLMREAKEVGLSRAGVKQE